MNSSIPYLIALSLALTSVQAEDFRFNPPPAATVLRDDRAEALPEMTLVLDVIANDIGFRPSEDSLRLLGSSTCGQMRVIDARSVEYRADAACAGQEVRQQYSLTRSGAEIDASATIILRVADNPVEPLPEPEVEIASTTTCPSIPGLNFTAIDTQLVKPHVLSGMTATEEQMELAPGHIAMVLADGDNVHDRTEAVIPDSRLITEFCIMPQQVQRAAGNSPGYSYNQVLANISELDPPSGWQLSLPTLWELLAASMHLFSDEDNQQPYLTYMRSLRDSELEWAQNVDGLCPSTESLILGPRDSRGEAPKPFHAYCENQNDTSASNDYGHRLVARKINPH